MHGSCRHEAGQDIYFTENMHMPRDFSRPVVAVAISARHRVGVAFDDRPLGINRISKELYDLGARRFVDERDDGSEIAAPR